MQEGGRTYWECAEEGQAHEENVHDHESRIAMLVGDAIDEVDGPV